MKNGKRRWRIATRVSALLLLLTPALALVRSEPHRERAAPIDARTARPATASAAPARRAEALAAYKAGAQAFEDAAVEAAIRNFDDAVEIDPTFAAAHLRLVLARGQPDGPAHEHANRAFQYRDSLSAHDRVLLEAILPWTGVPEDARETVRRLEAAVAQEPNDPDFAYHLCHMQMYVGDFAKALSTCDSAFAADSRMAVAVRQRALALERMGRVDESLAADKLCLQISPAAGNCLYDVWRTDSVEGHCDDALMAARRHIALEPESPLPYWELANALYAVGASIEAVRGALEQERARFSAKTRDLWSAAFLARLAILTGDLKEAESELAKCESASSDESVHVFAATGRAALALQEGNRAHAIDVANAFLKQRAGWTPQTLYDPSILFYGVLAKAGALPHAAFAATRASWLEREEARPNRTRAGGQSGVNPAYLWARAFAAQAETREDASAALDALARYLPMPDPVTRSDEIEAPIGNVYRLAGRLDEAIPILSRAAHQCLALDTPIENTLAYLDLGEALEAGAKGPEACAAYGVVLARWGHASRPARAADEARAGRTRLSCDRR